MCNLYQRLNTQSSHYEQFLFLMAAAHKQHVTRLQTADIDWKNKIKNITFYKPDQIHHLDHLLGS